MLLILACIQFFLLLVSYSTVMIDNLYTHTHTHTHTTCMEFFKTKYIIYFYAISLYIIVKKYFKNILFIITPPNVVPCAVTCLSWGTEHELIKAFIMRIIILFTFLLQHYYLPFSWSLRLPSLWAVNFSCVSLSSSFKFEIHWSLSIERSLALSSSACNLLVADSNCFCFSISSNKKQD